MAKPATEPRRKNRAVGIAEALGGALDPALKKRGFASRDLLAHWAAMAPPPYGETAFPDRLAWPRGERGAEGAVLHLRVAPGHALAAAHDGPMIAASINRYFGYLLVGRIRLSPEPFTPRSGEIGEKPHKPSEAVSTTVGRKIAHIQDDDLREALRTLGHAVLGRSETRNRG